MKIRLSEAIRHVWGPVLLATAPGVGAVLLWQRFAPPTSWLQIAAVVLSVGSIVVATAWIFCLSRSERERFLGYLRREAD